ncbi:MAG TPA: hypothetical protein VMR97_05925 [Acidimicrobiales bacterium]|nr:hypothetical protein [Acidimicrobiales bacterium]
MTSLSYSYPVVGAGSVPGARQKLPHTRFLAIAGVGLGVLVIVITAVVVLVKPGVQSCHFTCGPDVGPRLVSPTSFTSSEFGYKVEYDSGYFKQSNATKSGAEFDLTIGGGGILVFKAESGSDVNGAVDSLVNSISSNEIQNLQEIEPVPGAEIGEVEGSGTAFSGTFVPQGGGQTVPVSVVAMAASSHGLTIGVLAIDPQDLSSVQTLPLGFADGAFLDAPITDTIWPGQS